MSADAVADKFMASASLAIGQDQASRIRDAVLDLEHQTAAGLMALLRAQD
jgi:hypothetical protein